MGSIIEAMAESSRPDPVCDCLHYIWYSIYLSSILTTSLLSFIENKLKAFQTNYNKPVLNNSSEWVYKDCEIQEDISQSVNYEYRINHSILIIRFYPICFIIIFIPVFLVILVVPIFIIWLFMMIWTFWNE
jgi:hypothetical protein